MKQLFLISVASILAVEMACRFRWRGKISTLETLFGKGVRVFRSEHISDHYKERAIPAYSVRFAATCAVILLQLVCVLSPFVLAVLMIAEFGRVLTELYGPSNIGIGSGVCAVYFLLRKLIME